MIVLMILLFVLALLIILLFTPLALIIDTEKNYYAIRWGFIAIGSVIPVSKDLLIHVRITFWHRDWSLFELITKRKEPSAQKVAKEKAPESGRSGKIQKRLSPGKILRILRSFRIRTFAINLDTDDYTVNGLLYPAFYFMNGKYGRWQINFNNEFILKLKITNSPARVLMALM